MIAKTYLGDGVYVSLDEQTASLTLTAENGGRITDTIVIEPEVLTAFFNFLHDMRDAVESGENGRMRH